MPLKNKRAIIPSLLFLLKAYIIAITGKLTINKVNSSPNILAIGFRYTKFSFSIKLIKTATPVVKEIIK